MRGVGTIRAGRRSSTRGASGPRFASSIPWTWGCTNGAERVVSRREMLERLASVRGPSRTIVPVAEEDSAAPRDPLPGARRSRVGIISSTTEPFVAPATAAAHRRRLWYLCYTRTPGVDLRGALRGGGLARRARCRMIPGRLAGRRDRGAEERLALPERRPLDQIGTQARSPLEMHTGEDRPWREWAYRRAGEGATSRFSDGHVVQLQSERRGDRQAAGGRGGRSRIAVVLYHDVN